MRTWHRTRGWLCCVGPRSPGRVRWRERWRRGWLRASSLDEINERRGLWGGDGIPVEEWMQTHEFASAEVRGLLGSGTSVIVDDTSSPRFLRDGWRLLAEVAGVRFTLVYVDVDHATIRRRRADNQQDPRRRDVADAVLDQHLADFEPPGADEHAVRMESAADLQYLRI
ncbi:AAA family ATPase [Kribbella sp. NPDC026596]|uniref:AAA family ATPase n=1 Tax=Kribbella sp. NPDC026596 TaxID=3155122 RepID=UPI0033E7FFEE